MTRREVLAWLTVSGLAAVGCGGDKKLPSADKNAPATETTDPKKAERKKNKEQEGKN